MLLLNFRAIHSLLTLRVMTKCLALKVLVEDMKASDSLGQPLTGAIIILVREEYDNKKL